MTDNAKSGDSAPAAFIRQITCRYRRRCRCRRDIWPGDRLYYDLRTSVIMCEVCCPNGIAGKLGPGERTVP